MWYKFVYLSFVNVFLIKVSFIHDLVMYRILIITRVSKKKNWKSFLLSLYF